MVDFVPLSSLNATDGNVVYTQTAVLRVGYGSNVTVASGLFEANGQVGVGTTVYNSASKLQVEGNIFAANGLGMVFAEMAELDIAKDVFTSVYQ